MKSIIGELFNDNNNCTNINNDKKIVLSFVDQSHRRT